MGGGELVEPMVYMKVYNVRGEKLVAICDAELLGVKLVEKDVVLHVDERFYGGELVPLSIAIREASTATILNLVGKNTVQAAIKAGLVHPQAVLRVAGVPHAQTIRFVSQ